MADGLQERAPGLHRFLTRKDRPWPLVREALVGILVLVILTSLLFGLTAQPLVGGYPVVVVTSGSMMHCANGDPATHVGPPLGKDCTPQVYGRVGTIDPGDLVFVRSIGSPSDVATLAGNGGATYGNPGDVVVYRPYGSTAATPIIHRALFWLQVNADGTFTVDELGLHNVKTLNQEVLEKRTSCGLSTSNSHGGPLAPADSGFITRGDNNPAADQCPERPLSAPVQMGWVLGKARGELPWIGLVKLFFDSLGGSQDFANASSDTKTMMVVVLVVLLGGPWLIERIVRGRHKEKEGGDAQP